MNRGSTNGFGIFTVPSQSRSATAIDAFEIVEQARVETALGRVAEQRRQHEAARRRDPKGSTPLRWR